MQIQIVIDTDNAAFKDNEEGNETARILRAIAYEIVISRGLRADTWPLRDLNGNKVGVLKVTESEK